MAKILITGAAGFLGSHFTDRMLADGHRVTGVDNFITGDRRNLAHLNNEPRFDLIEHDITKGLDIAGDMDLVWTWRRWPVSARKRHGFKSFDRHE